MAEAELNGEIREIRETLAGIRSDIECLPEMRDDISKLQTSYATLAEKMEHPCDAHTGVVERIAQLEAVRNGERSAGRRTSGVLRIWLTGIAIAISCLTAILIAVLK